MIIIGSMKNACNLKTDMKTVGYVETIGFSRHLSLRNLGKMENVFGQA